MEVTFAGPRELDVKWTADAVRSLIGQRPRLVWPISVERSGEIVDARLGDDGNAYVTLDIPEDVARVAGLDGPSGYSIGPTL